MDLDTSAKVVGGGTSPEDAGEGVVVGLHMMAEGSVHEEAEGVEVEPVIDVAPDYDVEENSFLGVSAVE